ncbi:hypothetical protein ACWHIR_11980, partial [Streptomyces celluloflavus]
MTVVITAERAIVPGHSGANGFGEESGNGAGRSARAGRETPGTPPDGHGLVASYKRHGVGRRH